MNRVKAVWYTAILMSAFGLALAGCGRSDQQAAADTARAFIEAARKGDAAALEATLTTKAREQVHSRSDRHTEGSDTGDYTIGDAVINGDSADVPVRATQDGRETPITFKERREEGEWRIYAIHLDNENMTLDLEHPEAMVGDLLKSLPASLVPMFRGLGQGIGEMLKGIGQGVGAMVEGIRDGFGTAGTGR